LFWLSTGTCCGAVSFHHRGSAGNTEARLRLGFGDAMLFFAYFCNGLVEEINVSRLAFLFNSSLCRRDASPRRFCLS